MRIEARRIPPKAPPRVPVCTLTIDRGSYGFSFSFDGLPPPYKLGGFSSIVGGVARACIVI